MTAALHYPSVQINEAIFGPGTKVRLLLNGANPDDHDLLCEIHEWLSDLTPGTWGRWADPERLCWSFVFGEDVYAVQFTLMFSRPPVYIGIQ
jgi:hypothetical protein